MTDPIAPTRAAPGIVPGGGQPLTRHEVVAWRNALFVIFALCGIAILVAAAIQLSQLG